MVRAKAQRLNSYIHRAKAFLYISYTLMMQENSIRRAVYILIYFLFFIYYKRPDHVSHNKPDVKRYEARALKHRLPAGKFLCTNILLTHYTRSWIGMEISGF